MSFYSAKKKIKNIAAFLIILIFLPYVVSIFVNGKDVNLQNGSGHFTIKVARTDPDGTELDLDLDWEEYLIGVLAYDIARTDASDYASPRAYKPVQRTGRKRGEDGNREISDSCRNETEMGSGQF